MFCQLMLRMSHDQKNKLNLAFYSSCKPTEILIRRLSNPPSSSYGEALNVYLSKKWETIYFWQSLIWRNI